MNKPIVMLATGSRGDTDPFIALGKELQARGYPVRIVGFSEWADVVRAAGIECVELGPIEFKNDAMRDWRTWESGRGMRVSTRHLAKFRGMHKKEGMIDSVVAACADARAILGLTTVVAFHVGDAFDVPTAFVHLQPWEPTRAFPACAVSIDDHGPALNLATYTVSEKVIWLVMRRQVNRWRTEELGLDRIPLSGPGARIRAKRMQVFAAFSEHVIPRPDDWGSHVAVTGYWRSEPADVRPPAALVEFLERGDPPVYVGFGSWFPEVGDLDELIVAAFRKAGVRGVLQVPYPPEDPYAFGDDVLVVGAAPHDWLFPRTAAVIHHGGAGTTAAALRSGVPSVVCPFALDQPFWGARTAALGVGPASVPLKNLNADVLAAAMKTAVADPGMRAAAAELGRRLRSENGVESAANVFVEWLDAAERQQQSTQKGKA